MNSSALIGLHLHDIISAPAAGFWPPAPGWWILGIIILLLSYFIVRRLVRYLRQRHIQTRLMKELDTLSADRPDQIATNISVFLRRVVLMRYARNEVASLNGDDWLRFLDQTGGEGSFQNGIGKKLATLPYSPSQQMTDSDNQALIKLTRKWLQQYFRLAYES